MSKSMTGFAKRSFTWQDSRFELEVRTVNHRFLEVHLHLPRYSMELDQKLRRKVETCLHRGKVNLNIRVDGGDLSVDHELDEKRLEKYVTHIRQIEQRYDLEVSKFSAFDLVNLPGVLVEKVEANWPDDLEQALMSNLGSLLLELNEARSREGLELDGEIRNYLAEIDGIRQEIVELRDSFRLDLKSKFESKLKSFEQSVIDEQRLCMELAFIIEKSDVEEELVRLKSHLELAGELLSRSEPTGKEWNFLCQELNREINTIGSKSSQLKVSQLVLQAKSWLEKIREQVQNIE